MRRSRLWKLGVALLALIVFEIGSCQVFDAIVETEDAEDVVRGQLEVPVGWSISYIRQPAAAADAPRLIYVHGTPGDANAFRSYVQSPIPGFESISIDRPGFGRTRPRRPALTLREQAECIEPFLVQRGGRWPVLIGHSLGGPIVAQVAADYPGRVGGLVILSGSLDPAEEKVAWYQCIANLPVIAYMIPRFLRNSNRELLPMKAELESLQPRLAGIACPVIILHAPDDILVPFSNVAFMERNFPTGQIVDTVVLEGKNHFIPWNAETDVRSAVERLARAAEANTVVEESP